MPGQTPVYGLKFLTQGDPAYTTRQVLEDNARTTEAALLTSGAAPPAGALWATLSADSGWVTLGPPAATWSTPGLGRRYRVLGKVCYVQLEVQCSAAWAAGVAVFPNASFPLPSRAWWHQGVAYGNAALAVYVDAAGAFRMAGAGAASGGGFLCFDYPVG